MLTVHKWVLPPEPGTHQIPMAVGAEILTAREQQNHIAVWVRVTPGPITAVRTLHVVMTGNVKTPTGRYLGTAIFANGTFVLHVFEGENDEQSAT